MQAEHKLCSTRNTGAAMSAVEANQWAWLMPTLLLRSACESAADKGDENQENLRTRTTQSEQVKSRLQLAETGRWHELLRRYVDDLSRCRAREAERAGDLLQDSSNDESTFLRTANKMRVGNIR